MIAPGNPYFKFFDLNQRLVVDYKLIHKYKQLNFKFKDCNFKEFEKELEKNSLLRNKLQIAFVAHFALNI